MKYLILIVVLMLCACAMGASSVDAQQFFIVNQSYGAGNVAGLEFRLMSDGSAQLYDIYGGTVISSGYSWDMDIDGTIYVYDSEGNLVLVIQLDHVEHGCIYYYAVLYTNMPQWLFGDTCTGYSNTIGD
jgi:hypothetical protein